MPSSRPLSRALLAGCALALLLVATAEAGKRSRKPVRVDTDPAGTPPDRFDNRMGFSADGKVLVFQAGPNEGIPQILTWDVKAKRSTLISAAPAGGGGNEQSYAPAISPDGRYVAFSSYATNLLAEDDPTVDDNDGVDIFLHDRDEGTTRLISRSAGQDRSANNLSYSPQFSPDGRFILFESGADDLTTEGPSVTSPSNNRRNVFVYDMQDESIVLGSVIDGDAGDVSDVGDDSFISPDGRFLTFSTRVDGVVPAVPDTNDGDDLFIRDLVEGRTEVITINAAGTSTGSLGKQTSAAIRALSADGRFVLFASTSGDLVPADTNEALDLFLRDRELGTTTLVSARFDGLDSANGSAGGGEMTPGGRYVVFRSHATDLFGPADPEPPREDGGVLVILDRKKGKLRLINRKKGSQLPANGGAFSARISENGRFVTFESQSSELDRRKTDDSWRVFRYDVRRKRARVQAGPAAADYPVAPEELYVELITTDARGKWLAYVVDGEVGEDRFAELLVVKMR